MSTDWGIRCLTCGVDNVFYDMTSRHAARSVLAAAPLLGRIFGVVNHPLLKDIEVDFKIDYSRHLGLEWFKNHQGHSMAVVNEYGQLEDECGEYFACPLCNHQERCALVKGHAEMPHSKVRPK